MLTAPVKPRLLLLAIVDYLRGKVGMSPIFVRAIGKPNEFAMLNTPSCYDGKHTYTPLSLRIDCNG